MSAQVVVLCNTLRKDALVCCLSIPPDTSDDDATQRIMRHILEIKRIAQEFKE
jgi:hypothetical protein